MLRSYASDVWRDDVVRERLSWYYMVLRNLRPAKFLICKTIACNNDPGLMTEAELWKKHDRLRHEFLNRLREFKVGKASLAEFDKPRFTFLDLKVELLNRILHECVFCEWRCKVDRVEGKRMGACHLDRTARVASFFLHTGEEPAVSYQHGSGTVFFTSCTFKCVYCQNFDISQDPHGVRPSRLKNSP